MKRHYLYVLPLICGVIGYSSGIDDNAKDTASPKATGPTGHMSSRMSQDAIDPAELQSLPLVPTIPLKNSSPRDIPSPKGPSPKERMLKQRYVHPSGDYTAKAPASPKQNLVGPTASPPTDNQKPNKS